MIDPLPRLKAVEAEVGDALGTARDVLSFALQPGTPAQVKVSVCNNLIVMLVSIVEEAFRSLLIEYMSILEEEMERYSSLRKELSAANIHAASDLLKNP